MRPAAREGDRDDGRPEVQACLVAKDGLTFAAVSPSGKAGKAVGPAASGACFPN